ncbi:MAG: GNAT family N-acetyltransferase [Rhodospirillaceae bacterium]|nr:GNAT family N-acetyltransferase [Rhodospirillaceae bacterium]
MSVLLPQDYDGLRDALKAAGLPADDIDQPNREFFRFVTDDGGLLGYGGYEAYGAEGLLRSVVILEQFRGWGFGLQFLKVLEDLARFNGLARLWLLTTTAEAFFAKCGYAKAERGSAPAIIRATKEFTTLCPDSAVCMVKAL